MRQMTLIAFLQAQNCTNLASSWRHPQSRTDTWSADYYRHVGRVLEEGCQCQICTGATTSIPFGMASVA